jgi:hypothetical protein
VVTAASWQSPHLYGMPQSSNSRVRFGSKESKSADSLSLSDAVEKEAESLGKGQRVCVAMIDWYQRMTRQSKLAVKLGREQTGIFGCGLKDRGISEWSCSEYTKEAIQKYGVIKGIWKGFLRIMMCNPFTFRIKALQKFCIIP